MGYPWLMSVHAMTAIIVCYLIFAPRLFRMSRAHGYITPGDFVMQRFRSRGLRLLVTVCMIFALANYTLAQLKVMGHAAVGLSGGRITALQGVMALAIIMVVYETLGGMRGVVWTDAIQGLLLLFGFGALMVLVWQHLGGLGVATEALVEMAPDKLVVPDLRTCATWLSFVLLVGIGGSVYPQAIQRIYAARSERTLQRSLAVMSLLPLLTTLVVFSLGITAIVHYPGLDKSGSDQVLALILKDVMVTGPLGYWTVVLLLAAVLAALMSTADSALLAISSMVSRDIYGGLINPEASEAAQTRLGKVTSWVVISAMVWVSTQEDLTLVRLLVIKFEVLIQVAPAFFLGVRWARLGGRAVFAGLVVGLCVSLGLWALGAKPAGFHPGIVGLVANVLTIVIVQRLDASPQAQA